MTIRLHAQDPTNEGPTDSIERLTVQIEILSYIAALGGFILAALLSFHLG